MKQRIDEILLTLTPTEETIIRFLFGIDKPRRPFSWLIKHFQVSKKHLKHIIDKAEKKLKNKSRQRFELDFNFETLTINDLNDFKPVKKHKPLTLANYYAESEG